VNMSVLNKEESERLDRIERGCQYGVTMKDLFWLLRIVRRLEKTATGFKEVPAKAVLLRRSAS
jgi:hypothetical protein